MSSRESHARPSSDNLKELQARFENASIEDLMAQAARVREIAPDLAAGFAMVGLQSIAAMGLFVDDLPGTSPGDLIKHGEGSGSAGDARNAEAFATFDPPQPWEIKWRVVAINTAQIHWKLDDQICKRIQHYLDRKTLQDWRNGKIHEGYHIDCSKS